MINIELSQFCYQLCALSYLEDAASDIDFFEVGHVRCGVYYDGNNVFIVIRGTANFENLLRDLWIVPTKTPKNYMAHKGFVNAARELLPELGKRRRSLPVAPNIITGHSLGGAVAVLLAERFNCQVITFGSPRPYFKFFGRPKLQHTRFVRDDDPIPLLPGVRFQHDCKAVVIRDTDKDPLYSLKDHKLSGYLPTEENI